MSSPLNDRPVLQMLSITEQPDTHYICFPPAESRVPVGIDYYRVADGVFEGSRMFNSSRVVVIVLPAEEGWVVYHRSLIKLITQEDAIRQTEEVAKATREFLKTLQPPTDGDDDGEGGLPAVVMTPTGQYL